MHREIKKEKKVVSIIVSLFITTILLYIYQFIKMINAITIVERQIIAIVLILITVVVLFTEIKRCMTAYKYSIISDKLIINRINKKGEENIESFKFKDIIYIGEKDNLPKEYSKVKCNKYYTRDININKKIYCIYKKEDKLIKFAFEPSSKLINYLYNNKQCVYNN